MRVTLQHICYVKISVSGVSPLYVGYLGSQSLDFFLLGCNLPAEHLLQRDQLLLLGEDLIFLIVERKTQLIQLRLTLSGTNLCGWEMKPM